MHITYCIFISQYMLTKTIQKMFGTAPTSGSTSIPRSSAKA